MHKTSGQQTHAANIQDSLEEIASAAEEIYEKQYRQDYEKDHHGAYVVINIKNRKAYVGEFAEEILQRARMEDRYGVFHLMRVGSPTVFRVSR